MSRPASPPSASLRPRPPLSPDAIAAAALKLVDREGLAALSMRRVGAELGVEAMALYHHFPNKAALVEAVMALGSPGALPTPVGDWRSDLKALMNAVYHQLAAHPALLPLRWSRRTRSPVSTAILDRERVIFEKARLGPDLARDAHRLLGSYVVGFVTVAVEANRGAADEEWTMQFNRGLDIVVDGIDANARRSPARRKSRA